MKNFFIFLKKELVEYAKTYKLFIMLIVFTIFGITNALMAKLLPEILGSLVTDGFAITIPEPTALDSWAQFFKNATQMGLIVTVIVFSGILSSELSRGTLINMLTKGLSRHAVILSKYIAMLLIWTVSLLVCFVLTLGYTIYLFPEGDTANLAFSVFCLWLFGMFLLAIVLFASTLTRKNYGCLLLTGAGASACMLLNLFPAAHDYNPVSLATDNMGILAGTIEASSLNCAVIIAAVLSLVLVIASLLVFRKKQI